MTDIQIAWNLSQAWRNAARDRQICFEFFLDRDLNDIGRTGDKILCGVEPEGDRCRYFARNQTTHCEIPNPVIEKTIPGTDVRMQFNRGRAWRPGARTRQPGRQPEISGAWQDCRFDCQIPTGPNSGNSLLVRDPLLQVQLAHWRWNAYHNLAPFESEGHFIWIPVRQQGLQATMPHYPQQLTCEFLADFLHLGSIGSQMLYFFNSLHAGASVNHIHLQSIAYTDVLPLERAIASAKLVWRGCVALLRDYFVNALIFRRDVGITYIFPYIDRLQRRDDPVPFNLLLLQDWVCLVPRNIDNEVISELPRGALGSLEMAGKFIAADPDTYNFADADPSILDEVYQKVSLSWPELEALFDLPASS